MAALAISQLDGLLDIMIRRFPDKLPLPHNEVNIGTPLFLVFGWAGYAALSDIARYPIKAFVALILGVVSALYRVKGIFDAAAYRTSSAASAKVRAQQRPRDAVGPRTSPHRA
jgi:hypothetical protein